MRDKTERILKSVDTLGKMPPTLSKVMELINSVNPSPKEFARAISLDPILTFEILKLINSSFYGLANHVSSVQQAIVLLGLTTVKNLCLALSLAKKLNDGVHTRRHFDLNDFWAHSMSVAICAKLIAKKTGFERNECDEVFLAGLLHDIGKVVAFRTFPEDYGLVLDRSVKENLPLEELEQATFGITHAGLGEVIGERWSFPDWFTAAVAGHHATDSPDPKVRRIQVAVMLANFYCKKLGINGEKAGVGTYAPVAGEVFEYLKVNPAELEQFLAEVLPVEVEHAASFVGTLSANRR
ncbi:MAG: HDOD domain-containing protein [Planctomycetes bacterium]|nr:HDOD domain-containing protein [Planctomycetota bacterium]